MNLKWWQAGIYELAIVSVGILIGSHWPQFWLNFTNYLWIVSITLGAYVFCIYFKGK